MIVGTPRQHRSHDVAPAAPIARSLSAINCAMSLTPTSTRVGQGISCACVRTSSSHSVVAPKITVMRESAGKGQVRSAFCMTEPEVASSDAGNIRAQIVDDGADLVLNGTKWWSTGLGHPHCRPLIFMGPHTPEAHRPSRPSTVPVPRDPAPPPL